MKLPVLVLLPGSGYETSQNVCTKISRWSKLNTNYNYRLTQKEYFVVQYYMYLT